MFCICLTEILFFYLLVKWYAKNPKIWLNSTVTRKAITVISVGLDGGGDQAVLLGGISSVE
jgi:hypothetical protein